MANVTGAWRVQVGKDKGRYTDRYVFTTMNRAIMYFNGINVGRGYKKRLIDPDGQVVYRVLT